MDRVSHTYALQIFIAFIQLRFLSVKIMQFDRLALIPAIT